MGKSGGGGSSESIKGPRSASTPEELTKVGRRISVFCVRGVCVCGSVCSIRGGKGESGDEGTQGLRYSECLSVGVMMHVFYVAVLIYTLKPL